MKELFYLKLENVFNYLTELFILFNPGCDQFEIWKKTENTSNQISNWLFIEYGWSLLNNIGFFFSYLMRNEIKNGITSLNSIQKFLGTLFWFLIFFTSNTFQLIHTYLASQTNSHRIESISNMIGIKFFNSISIASKLIMLVRYLTKQFLICYFLICTKTTFVKT